MADRIDENYWRIQYEVACETISHLIALYVEVIERERLKPAANRVRIASHQEECRRLAAERRALSSQDRTAVADLIDYYAPVVR